MCEIFPEVSKCCFVMSLRIGMLFISVIAIMTGVTMICGIEKVSNASFKRLKNVTEIRDAKKVMSHLSQIIPSGITAMGCLFMICGLILLFSTLTDAEGFAQIFVWLTFLTVMIGFIMVAGIALECIMMDKCLLSNMDWLSGATVLVVIVAYLFLWIYFITVANSYVLNVYS